MGLRKVQSPSTQQSLQLRVLELGCGRGGDLFKYGKAISVAPGTTKNGASSVNIAGVSLIVGVDVSKVALDEASRRLVSSNSDQQQHCGSHGGQGRGGGGNRSKSSSSSATGWGWRRGDGNGGGAGRQHEGTATAARAARAPSFAWGLICADMGGGGLRQMIASLRQGEISSGNDSSENSSGDGGERLQQPQQPPQQQLLAAAAHSFDACACHFSLHYVCDSLQRATTFLRELRQELRPGAHFVATVPDCTEILCRLELQQQQGSDGNKNGSNVLATAEAAAEGLGNDVYSVEFLMPPSNPSTRSAAALGATTSAPGRANTATTVAWLRQRLCSDNPWGVMYNFTLGDAVATCPEALVPVPALVELAAEHGLRLTYDTNLGDFVQRAAEAEQAAAGTAAGTMLSRMVRSHVLGIVAICLCPLRAHAYL